MGTELLCIGNAIVDIFAGSLDFSRLDRLGICEPVQHIERSQMDAVLEELGLGGLLSESGGSLAHNKGTLPPGTVLGSGGGAANVAKIASMLGMKAAFAGSAGGDSLAGIFRRDLAAAGVRTLLKTGTGKTGACLIAHEKGKARFAASPGAALEFTEADVEESLITGVDAVVLDGYVLDRRPLVQRILRLADSKGVPAALDTASVFQAREKAEEILHYCRNYPLILFMNADEAIAFYHQIRKGGDKENAATEREKESFILRDICPMFKTITEGELFPIIAIKLGGRGAAIIAGGTVYREETFTITAPRDATGAGDAFCAAFLAAWIRGRPLSGCAVMGNKAAREILDVPGTRIQADKLKHLAKQLQKHPEEQVQSAYLLSLH